MFAKQLAASVYSSVKVLAILVYNEESYVSEILKLWSQRLYFKIWAGRSCWKAIKTVQGGQPFSKDVMRPSWKGLIGTAANLRPNLRLIYLKFLEGKSEVLRLIAGEFTTQEIADKLFISLEAPLSRTVPTFWLNSTPETAPDLCISLENGLLSGRANSNFWQDVYCLSLYQLRWYMRQYLDLVRHNGNWRWKIWPYR